MFFNRSILIDYSKVLGVSFVIDKDILRTDILKIWNWLLKSNLGIINFSKSYKTYHIVSHSAKSKKYVKYVKNVYF